MTFKKPIQHILVLLIVVLVGCTATQPAFHPLSTTDDTPTLLVQDTSACEEEAENPVAAENCHAGTDEWIVFEPQGDIENFVYPPSANIGESVDLYVNTDAATFDLSIYRLGYYGGTGGRLIQVFEGLEAHAQPPCYHEQDTGLDLVQQLDCLANDRYFRGLGIGGISGESGAP